MKRAEKPAASIPFNFAMQFLLKMIGPLCAAVSYPYAFRVLGQTEIGRVAFTTSVTGIFLLIANLGIPAYGIRECARVRDNQEKLNRTVYELLAVQGLMTLMAEVLLFLSVLLVPRLRGEWRFFLVQGAALLFQGVNTEWLFSALERYGFLTLRSCIVKILSLMLLLCLVHGPEDALLYCGLTAGTAAASILLNLPALRNILQSPQRAWKPNWRVHIRPALIFFAQAAAIMIYTGMDEALLGFLRGDSAVGAYDAAVKIKLVLTYFTTGLGAVLLPRFSYYAARGGRELLERGLYLSGDFLWITTLPLTAFFFLMGEDCLTTLYGSAEGEVLWSLHFLILTLVPIGCTNLIGIQILTPMGQEKKVMWSVAVGAAVDMAADLIAIPRFGAVGAAFGTLLAELAVLLVQARAMRTVRGSIGTPFRWITGVKALAATMAALPMLSVIRVVLHRPVLRVLVGAVIYFALVYALMWIGGDELLRVGFDRMKQRASDLWEKEGGSALRLDYLAISLCSLVFMACFGAVNSFWYDEFAQICFSGPGKSLVDSLLTLDPTPPLFNVAANLWYHLMPYGDRWLLLLPQLATAGAVYLAGLWGEKWGGRSVGVWTALFLGFSQMVMEQCGFEFRSYGFYLLFATAAFLLHWRRVTQVNAGPLSYALVLAGLLYSHLFGALIVGSLFLWDVFIALKAGRGGKELLPYGGAGLLFLPWVLFFLSNISSEAASASVAWMVQPSPWEVVKLVAYLCGNHIVLCLLLTAAMIHVFFAAFRERKLGVLHGTSVERLAPLFVAALTILAVYLFGLLRSGYATLWEKRYFTGLFPCAAVLSGYGADSVIRAVRQTLPKRGTLAALLLGTLLFLTTVPYFLVRTALRETPLAIYHHREAAELLLQQSDIHEKNVLVLSTLGDYTEGWTVYYVEEQGKREGFLPKGVGQITPEEVTQYDVIYYDYGFWPENAESSAEIQTMKRNFSLDHDWENLQVSRYVRKQQTERTVIAK